jgi:hypothetical protein
MIEGLYCRILNIMTIILSTKIENRYILSAESVVIKINIIIETSITSLKTKYMTKKIKLLLTESPFQFFKGKY